MHHPFLLLIGFLNSVEKYKITPCTANAFGGTIPNNSEQIVPPMAVAEEQGVILYFLVLGLLK